MRYFLWSHIVAVTALVLSFVWASTNGLLVTGLLIVMEIGFSFDNAVVNATVLRDMSEQWQQRFLTWGMLFAVFGMYLLFPLLIVALAVGKGLGAVLTMALDNPAEYSQHLHESHTQIAAFGGMFLLMVFFKFLFDSHRELHWLGLIERKLSRLGKLESVEAVVALLLLLTIQSFLPVEEQQAALQAGVIGVVLYVLVQSVTGLLNGGDENTTNTVVRYSGLMGFIYLNLLDASFSLDAVIGSFAISKDIVIIMLGLSAGAMYVRSLTVYLVRKGTLDDYVYLEHGAHYGIGALSLIMLLTLVIDVPEVITGLVGVAFILLSFVSSVRHKRRIA